MHIKLLMNSFTFNEGISVDQRDFPFKTKGPWYIYHNTESLATLLASVT